MATNDEIDAASGCMAVFMLLTLLGVMVLAAVDYKDVKDRLRALELVVEKMRAVEAK